MESNSGGSQSDPKDSRSDVNVKVTQISTEMNEIEERLQKSQENMRSFSTFLNSSPLAASSPWSSSSLEIQQLKALMPEDDPRRHCAR